MLIAILRGSQLDGRDGWFKPAATRYTFEWLAKQNGLDAKAASIPRDKFTGEEMVFNVLDRDGDGKITAADLDWSDRNPFVMQTYMLNRLFRRMDASGDGQLTREELDAFFKMVAKEKDHFTADDFRRAMIPRGPAGFSPASGPSIPVLVRGLFAGEIGSISEGPKLDEPAPKFNLKTADGKETVQLSKLIGPKPVVLVFGNFTCGPFRGYVSGRGRGSSSLQGPGYVRDGLRSRSPSGRWVEDGVEHAARCGCEAAHDIRRARRRLRTIPQAG